MPTTPDRTTRFMARIEELLTTLPDDADRRSFLNRQIEEWEARYNSFIVKTSKSDSRLSKGLPSAADYLLTITELTKRLDALQPWPHMAMVGEAAE